MTGIRAGEFEITATVMIPADADAGPVTLTIPVLVTWPRVTKVEIEAERGRLYEQTTLGHEATAYHADGTERHEATFRWSSSDPTVATLDRFGNVTGRKPGSAGDKYVILDVRDLSNPKYVSEYNHPDSRLHDVWVHDGIAYSSEWQTGVVVVDVGNGRWGGTIETPKFVTNIPYPVGANHAAYPYFQKSTGKFYLFLGDEIMARDGKSWSGAGLGQIPEKGGTPSVTSGYIHIVDFTDPERPKDVARYEVPEYGTHNLWVKDDKLYVAYYEGDLRVVDVSGERMGNLYEQGREIVLGEPPCGLVLQPHLCPGPA